MIQTEPKTASVKPKMGKRNIPFETSVRREIGEKHATMNLMGSFTGKPEDLDVIEFAFFSRVIDCVPIVKLKFSETFHDNGQKVRLAEVIATHAEKKGKEITFDNFAQWEGVHQIFNK